MTICLFSVLILLFALFLFRPRKLEVRSFDEALGFIIEEHQLTSEWYERRMEDRRENMPPVRNSRNPYFDRSEMCPLEYSTVKANDRKPYEQRRWGHRKTRKKHLFEPHRIPTSAMVGDVAYNPLLELHYRQLEQVEGFKFCSMLNNATFRASVSFLPLFSAAEADHSRTRRVTLNQIGKVAFVQFIELIAQSISKDILRYRTEDFYKSKSESVTRLACFLAAQGQNEYLNFAEFPLLYNPNPEVYFPEIRFKPKPQQNRPHFKLAYTLLVHDSFNSTVALVEQLLSPNTFVLIHVDGKNIDLKRQLEKKIKSEPRWNKFKNVHLSESSIVAWWGAPALVFAQLAVYFELLDLCTFEFVLNASAYDVPLMHPDILYRYLTSFPKGFIWVSYLGCHPDDNYSRLNRPPSLHSRWHYSVHAENVPEEIQDMTLSSPKGMAYSAAHQWTVLTFEFIEYLRTDPFALQLLLPFEWLYLVDELYFSVYTKWTEWHRSVMRERTRCLSWEPGWPSPSKVSEWMYDHLWECVDIRRIFTRKWHIDEEPQLVLLLKNLRYKARSIF